MTRSVKIVPNWNPFGKTSLSLQIMEDELKMMKDDVKLLDLLEIMEDDQKYIENIKNEIPIRDHRKKKKKI
jgi:hypothetical protein